MSKELTPLEVFKELLFVARSYSNDNVGGYLEKFYKDKLDIIETALKNYVKILPEHENTTKKLKALEIIKEKGIVVQFIKETNSAEQYNAVISGYLLKPYTQEEYDLLKEVLM